MSSEPKANKELSEFANRHLNSLMGHWNKMQHEQIAVSAVLAQIAKIDHRARRLAFTTSGLSILWPTQTTQKKAVS
ncbi:Hypothetical protein NTJ_02695 [Nesidiocoris tenuis]|uniref:Uncharacterized protein n=1 Tax=Nesidiocoris tenuis TaxID=355587 RepID=A0ABN7AD33_9HEMI|nr:Hypothetical protein NTJ_02695 [Nesidiocoris tenuis]